MASIPHHQYYTADNCMFITNDQLICELPTTDHPMSIGTDYGSSGSSEETSCCLPSYNFDGTNNGGGVLLMNNNNMQVPSYDSSSDITSSCMSNMGFLPPPADNHRLGGGVSNMNISALPADYDRAGFFGIAAAGNNDHNQGFVGGCEFLEECSTGGLMASNFWPPPLAAAAAAYTMSGDNWEISEDRVLEQKVEEPTLTITRYSAEERKDRILRYLKKRSQRNFNKTIKYACRKTLADKRVRVRGRFAKNNNNNNNGEICSEEDESVMMMRTDQTSTCHEEQTDLYFNNPLQQLIKGQEEEWLQEAISNLMYYHILPDNTMDLLP